MLNQSSNIIDMEDRTRELDNLLDLYFKCCSQSTKVPQISQQIVKETQKDYFLESAISIELNPYISHEKAVLLSVLIKDKFKYYYELINPDKILPLYYKLWDLIQLRGSSEKAIFSNIAQSLALMYLNTFSSQAEGTLLQYLELFKVDKEETFQYYFKVLQYCAEDVGNRQIVLDQNKRKQIKEVLVWEQKKVIDQLESVAKRVLENQIAFNKKHLLTCFESWIQLHFNKDIYGNLHKYQIFWLVVNACCVEETVENATYCLNSIFLKITEENQCSSHYQDLSILIKDFIGLGSKKWVEGQHLVAEEVLRMVLTFMESFSKVMVENYSVEVREGLILPVLKFYQTGIQYVIRDQLRFMKELLANIQEEYRYHMFCNDFSRQIPIAILEAATRIIQYQPAHFEMLNTVTPKQLQNQYEEAEAIQDYRYLTLQIFQYICELMGPADYLKHVNEIIKQLQSFHHDPGSFLVELEAYLYAVHGPLRRAIKIDEEVMYLVQLSRNVLLSKDNVYAPIPLKRTVLKVLEGIFDMDHKKQGLTHELFGLAVQQLNEILLFQNAAKAIKRACLQNTQILQPLFFLVKQKAFQYYHQGPIMMGYVKLCSWDKIGAADKVGEVISFLHEIAFSQDSSKLEKKKAFAVLFDVFSSLKKYEFEGKLQMLHRYMEHSWQIFMHVFNTGYRFGEDQDECYSIERVVKVLKYVIRVINADFEPYIQPLFCQVSQLFKKMPLCSFVYLLEITIKTFSKNVSVSEYLKYWYENMSQTALSHLCNAESLSTYQFLADDFIGLNTRILGSNCAIIINSQAFGEFLRFVSRDCLNTQVPVVVKAACRYFESLFILFWSEAILKQAQEHEYFDTAVPILNDQDLKFRLKEYMIKESAQIISCLLSSLAEAKDHVHNLIVDVLFSQIKAFPLENPEIWSSFIQKLPSDILLQSQKQSFMNLLVLFRQKCYQNYSFKHEVSEIDKCLYMISKRMKISDKRKHFKKHD